MGQYYRPVLKTESGQYIVLNREVDGRYTDAKLIEHSWWCNPFVSTVTTMLYNNPHRIAWVGDYADGEPLDTEYGLHKLAFDGDGEGVEENETFLDGKYLVNHSKKVYLDCDTYKERSVDSDGLVLHPLPLLTAIGNGRGGGDYYGVNKEDVGVWCFDEIEVCDAIQQGYEPVEFTFIDA